RAIHARVGAAGVRLRAPDAVLVGDAVVRIGEQREREVVLLLELGVRALVVGRDAEHNGARALELAVRVADAARLRRAAGGVVLGIEIENDRLAAEIREPDPLATVAREIEVRRWLPFAE